MAISGDLILTFGGDTDPEAAQLFAAKIAALFAAVERVCTASSQLKDEVRVLKDALENEATTLEVAAVDWIPGAGINKRNPYAQQMFNTLRSAAARLRRAALSPEPQSGGFGAEEFAEVRQARDEAQTGESEDALIPGSKIRWSDTRPITQPTQSGESEDAYAIARKGLIAIIDTVEGFAHGDECEFCGEMVGDEQADQCRCGLSTIRTLAWNAVNAADTQKKGEPLNG